MKTVIIALLKYNTHVHTHSWRPNRGGVNWDETSAAQIMVPDAEVHLISVCHVGIFKTVESVVEVEVEGWMTAEERDQITVQILNEKRTMLLFFLEGGAQ